MQLEKYTGFNREINIDLERDRLLTPFGRSTLQDRYLWKNESSPQHMFARVACVNSDDNEHAQRMYDYMSKLWFMGSTPVLSNSGHEKNLPISCFLNAVGDSLEEIAETFNENFWLASRGGGIGTYWGEVRDDGEPVADRGKTAGIIPFNKIMDSQTLGISQGSLRRGSAASYLDVSHPEILEFLDIRDTTGGDANRKCLNLHHGVVIPNAFMQAVKDDGDWQLISPQSLKVKEVVKARTIWQKIITRRLESGEPYLWFVDNVNDNASPVYKANGLRNIQSNLCSEIALSTAIDFNGKRRTAVCCLSSINLEKWDEYQSILNDLVEDSMRFLDNVMQRFIDLTEGVPGFERARYAAQQERSIGLGVMGFHGFLQSKNVAFESAMAKAWNMKVFSALKAAGAAGNVKLALERGCCPDASRAGLLARFANIWAIAPTASISIIAGESSPGVDPITANIFKQKTLSGWFVVKNKNLDKLIKSKVAEDDVEDVWAKIIANDGSIQSIDLFDEWEKAVYRTAIELKQEWIIDHAADRQPSICQGQSINIWLHATISKRDINLLHIRAWEKGLKGLYYCRSKSIGAATNVGHVAGEMPQANETVANDDYSGGGECLACQ